MRTWVPILKPPHPATIPVLSELAGRLIEIFTVEAIQEEIRIRHSCGNILLYPQEKNVIAATNNEFQFSKAVEKPANVVSQNEEFQFPNPVEGHKGNDSGIFSSDETDSTNNSEFNQSGFFSPYFEPLSETPQIRTGKLKEKNNVEANIVDQSLVLVNRSNNFDENHQKKRATSNGSNYGAYQPTIDHYFKTVKRNYFDKMNKVVSDAQVFKNISESDDEIICETPEPIVNESLDKGKAGNDCYWKINSSSGDIFELSHPMVGDKRCLNFKSKNVNQKVPKMDNSIRKITTSPQENFLMFTPKVSRKTYLQK